MISSCPPPGIYEGIDFATYLAWPAINSSGLTKFSRSPAHYIAGKAEDEDTASKARGTICHAGILEPSRFDAEYAIGPDVKLNTKGGKEEWEAFCAAHPGKEHVRGADGEAMLGCRKSIWSHEFARQLLSSDGPCEVCIVWIDPVTGLLCKARIDKLALAYSFVVDLKTTRDARPEPFSKSIWEYKYFRQAAFNLFGLAQLGIAIDGFAIIAVEPVAPYALIVYEIDHEAIEAGHIEICAAMEGFALCKKLNAWGGYPKEVQRIGLPDWAKRKRNTSDTLTGEGQ